MDEDYKEDEIVIKEEELDPFGFTKIKITNIEDFNEKFISYCEEITHAFIENPTFDAVKQIIEILHSQENFDRNSFISQEILEKFISLYSNQSNDEECQLICDFVLSIITVPESIYPTLLCDLRIIEILFDILQKYPYFNNKIFEITAYLIPNNDIYHHQIFDLFFPFSISFLKSHYEDVSEIHNVFFFYYSIAHYYDFDDDQLQLFISLLLDFIEMDDYSSLNCILWSLRCISQSYTSELLRYENLKIIHQLLSLINRTILLTTIKDDNLNDDRYSNTIFLSLSIFHIILQKEIPEIELPLFEIIEVTLQILSYNINGTLNIESLFILSQIVKSNSELSTQFLLDHDIISFISSFMTDSSIGCKHQSLILFMKILQQCSNESANIILNDPRIEHFFIFVFDSQGQFFKPFAISLTCAIDKCHSIGCKREACQMMLDENVPQQIQDLVDSVNDNETELIGQSLLALLLEDADS